MANLGVNNSAWTREKQLVLQEEKISYLFDDNKPKKIWNLVEYCHSYPFDHVCYDQQGTGEYDVFSAPLQK